MANEIWAHYTSGFTLYAIIRRKSDDLVNIQGTNNFEAYNGTNIGNYDHPMLDDNGDFYSVDFPATITNTELTEYRVGVYLAPSGTPADSDFPIQQGEIFWQDGEEIDLGGIYVSNRSVNNVYDESQPTSTGVAPGVIVINESIGNV